MYINYDYYRVFYFVAKYGSLSQASKQLMNNQGDDEADIVDIRNKRLADTVKR